MARTGGRDFEPGFDPRRQLHRGPNKESQSLRRELINHYVDHCADALLDVLEARGMIPQLVERYNTRKRCERPQRGGWPWRKVWRKAYLKTLREP